MNPPATDREAGYADLVAHRGSELSRAVAVIAEGDGPLIVHGPGDEHPAGLVLALALLAAGLPHDDAVAAAAVPVGTHSDGTGSDGPHPAALLDALAMIGERGGPEAYLLRHGLTVSHFHLLRERFAGDEAGLAAGDVS